MAKAGREFEEAVARFVAALDPSAEVLFNRRVPDRDTGTRQVDVWINTKFGGHIPFAILVSCKDHARPLTREQIETFANERTMTGANMGIIYSGSGFAKSALEKAKILGITCCRLYRHQPSELPHSIMFDHYCCFSVINLTVEKAPGALKNVETWNQLFDMPEPEGDGTYLDLVQRDFEEQKQRYVYEKPQDQHFPFGWETRVAVNKAGALQFTLVIQVGWRRYRGRAEAILLDGSYSYANSSFRGTQFSPAFDRFNPPGPGWTEMTDSDPAPSPRSVVLIACHGDVRNGLRQHLGDRRLA